MDVYRLAQYGKVTASRGEAMSIMHNPWSDRHFMMKVA